MSVSEPRHHPDLNPAEDLAFERETLDESIRHDYSTPETGIVPLNRRRTTPTSRRNARSGGACRAARCRCRLSSSRA